MIFFFTKTIAENQSGNPSKCENFYIDFILQFVAMCSKDSNWPPKAVIAKKVLYFLEGVQMVTPQRKHVTHRQHYVIRFNHLSCLRILYCMF